MILDGLFKKIFFFFLCFCLLPLCSLHSYTTVLTAVLQIDIFACCLIPLQRGSKIIVKSVVNPFSTQLFWFLFLTVLLCELHSSFLSFLTVVSLTHVNNVWFLYGIRNNPQDKLSCLHLPLTSDRPKVLEKSDVEDRCDLVLVWSLFLFLSVKSFCVWFLCILDFNFLSMWSESYVRPFRGFSPVPVICLGFSSEIWRKKIKIRHWRQ